MQSLFQVPPLPHDIEIDVEELHLNLGPPGHLAAVLLDGPPHLPLGLQIGVKPFSIDLYFM